MGDDHDDHDERYERERCRRLMLDWLLSADAKAAAGAELTRRGLTYYDGDELISETYLKLARTALATVPDKPVAYARTALANAALDLLRARRPASPTDFDDEATHVAAPHHLEPDNIVELTNHQDDIRRSLHASLASTKSWIVAAALNAVTLAAHPDVQLPARVPRPADPSDGQADLWAALWLAGERHVFASKADPDDSAKRRQARSRALKKVTQLLISAARATDRSGLDG